MEGGKNKTFQKKKGFSRQTVIEFLAVVILAVATVFTFINCPKTVYGYDETTEDRVGYFPKKSSYCFLSLTAPNGGGNYCTIQINFHGPTGIGTDRWDFAKQAREITLTRSKIWGNTAFEGTLVDTKVTTTQNSGDGMTIVKFRVKWKLPAHYTWVSSETNPVYDRPDNNTPRFNCWDSGISHHTDDTTFIATYEINLANTGLISPAGKKMRRVGCAARIKIYRPKYNHKFLGWSTNPHATTDYEQPGATVTALKTVTYYAIWQSIHGNSDLANVITGDGMFTNDTELEGQNGTGYNSLHDGLDYAHPDEGVDNPGYYYEK